MSDERQAAWVLYASDVIAEISSISSDDAWLKAEKRRGLPRGLLKQSGWVCMPVWISERSDLGITTEPAEILGIKPSTIGVLNDE